MAFFILGCTRLKSIKSHSQTERLKPKMIALVALMVFIVTTGSVSAQLSRDECVASATHNCPPRIEIQIPFNQIPGVVQLKESVPLNSILAIMQAKDDNTGPAGNISCLTHNSNIRMDERGTNAYTLHLAKSLDRELENRVDITIVCTDAGSPPLSTTASFVIHVIDVNDNQPEFTNDPYVSVKLAENVPVGHFVTRVSATDADEGENGEVFYYIPSAEELEIILGREPEAYYSDKQSGGDDKGLYTDEIDGYDYDASDYSDSYNETLPFKVDKSTGDIYTDGVIDREMNTEIIIPIVASDKGKPRLMSATFLQVTVTDMNDNKPMPLTQELHARENQPVRTLVGHLRANDLDEGRNGEVVFTKRKSRDEETEGGENFEDVPFIVKNNGKVLTKAVLDREERDRYLLHVVLKDKGKPRLSTTTSIWIMVDDVNDNSPEIMSRCLGDDADVTLEDSEEPNGARRGRDSGAGEARRSEINDMTGLGGDVFDDNTISYRYNGEDGEGVTPLFEPYDSRDTSTDSDISGENGSKTSNRKRTRPLRSGEVLVEWSSPQGQRPVYKVLASDLDTGQNGNVYYSISAAARDESGGYTEDASGTYPGYGSVLGINATTGEVYLRRHLVVSDDLTQIVRVTARDGGNPSLSTTCLLNVTFDVNVTMLTPPPVVEVDIFNSNSSTNSTDDASQLGPMCVLHSTSIVCAIAFIKYIVENVFLFEL